MSEPRPAHAFTGFDTAACCYWVCKSPALNVQKDGYSFLFLGVIDSPIKAVTEQAITLASYGKYTMSKSLESMGNKTGRASAVASKLVPIFPQVRHF